MTQALNFLTTNDPHATGQGSVRAVAVDPSTAPVIVDAARMNAALASKEYALPSGLSREEKRQFILSMAARR